MKTCAVLIPYHNDGTALLKSIHSIDITHDGPDILVVDDGSTVQPASELLSGIRKTRPITIITRKENKGIEHALNAGLDHLKDSYKYIARLDCGDTCKNNRIHKQVTYLNNNPNCVLVGSWADAVDIKGNYLYTIEQPESSNNIKKRMLINNAFIHPGVMYRSEIINKIGFYPTDYPAAEDYAFFVHITRHFDTHNIQESLINYEINPHSISHTKRRTQITSRLKVITHHYKPSPMWLYSVLRCYFLLFSSRNLITSLRTKFRNSAPGKQNENSSRH